MSENTELFVAEKCSASECENKEIPELPHLRDMTEKDFFFTDEIIEMSCGKINLYMPCNPVLFGKLISPDTDDYFNVYVLIDVHTGVLDDYIDVNVYRANGDIEYYKYHLSDADKRLVSITAEEYVKAYVGVPLSVMCSWFRKENN